MIARGIQNLILVNQVIALISDNKVVRILFVQEREIVNLSLQKVLTQQCLALSVKLLPLSQIHDFARTHAILFYLHLMELEKFACDFCTVNSGECK